MQYVEVLVAEPTYHRQEALTYGSDDPAAIGGVVIVPLQGKAVAGIVSGPAKKPRFAVKKVVDTLQYPPLPKASMELLDWMRWYYPAPLGILTGLFLPQKLFKKIEPKTTGPVHTQVESSIAQPRLTDDQIKALKAIQGAGLHLLHGETGTGKTRVYIELAKRSIENGSSALILTPEIGLTAQLINDFKAIFGERVILIHSQLSEARRRQIWAQTLKSSEPIIVIGPRSALFSPIRKLGLIVIDESHETAYKQDRAPYYHASIVAAKLASLHGATLVLGSATPLITDYAIAEAKKRPIVRMTQTAVNTGDSHEYKVEIVDLRNRSTLSKNQYLSDQLLKGMRQTLDRNEQVLLFLNRRGTARMVFCEHCGWQAACPHCDLPLVYHGDSHRMRCHTCAYQGPSPMSCPECHNTSVVFKSIGTKAIAQHVAESFPDAKIQRFDTDNKRNERLERHLDEIRSGGIDIIIGTQTIAKGLDLPKLGLVGVVLADTSLSFPDFSAQERTYQLISQVVGRAGRGHRNSSAIIQTYNPGNPVLKAVFDKDWETFYSQEIDERQKFHFPPFRYVLKLSCRRASQASAEKASQALIEKLRTLNPAIELEGPAPSFREKVQDKYQWQIIVKSRRRSDLLGVIAALPANWSYDIDPLNLL